MLTLSMSMAGQALHKLQNWEIMVEVWVEVVTVVELARPGSHWSQLWWILLAAAAAGRWDPSVGSRLPWVPPWILEAATAATLPATPSHHTIDGGSAVGGC